jgi:hypothetical protein
MGPMSRRWCEPQQAGHADLSVTGQLCITNPPTNLDRLAASAAGRSSLTHSTMSSTQYSGATPLNSVIPFPVSGDARTGVAAETVRHVEIAIGLMERLLDFGAVVAAVWSAYWIHAASSQSARAHY